MEDKIKVVICKQTPQEIELEAKIISYRAIMEDNWYSPLDYCDTMDEFDNHFNIKKERNGKISNMYS